MELDEEVAENIHGFQEAKKEQQIRRIFMLMERFLLFNVWCVGRIILHHIMLVGMTLYDFILSGGKSRVLVPCRPGWLRD
jgi:hypothetical protein